MDRRFLLTSLAGAVAAPITAKAQQPSKVHQIGCLIYGSPVEFEDRIRALRAGLRDYGYVEGKNITLEFRWAETAEQLPELAADLVRLNVDVIFANSSTEVEAARRATKTVPIVFASHADPVGVGHVSSLARPGGNITGGSVLLTEIVAKQLEIMKQVLPHLKRIGVLVVVTAPSTRPALHAVEAAAHRLGVQVLTVPVRTPENLDGAFTMMARERVSGYLAVQSPLIRSQRTVIAELSLKHRLAGMFGAKENVEAGGLMLYFADIVDLTRRVAAYIDKILKGAKPADLPVEQASKYQLIVNLKTAKALGLTIPPSLLARADQVIDDGPPPLSADLAGWGCRRAVRRRGAAGGEGLPDRVSRPGCRPRLHRPAPEPQHGTA
jgi:putative ABC transport system substrate-binding protein